MRAYFTGQEGPGQEVVEFSIQRCPECSNLLVIKALGPGIYAGSGGVFCTSYVSSEIIYPVRSPAEMPSEVPEEYAREWMEARAVFPSSAKASAALSRRLLQMTFHEALGIKRRDLSLEIDAFIEESGAPTYLVEAVDAVRNIGNFAAHPIKSVETGAIADVDAGEAEWLLEVLMSLFDFVFVQPERLKRRRENLEEKLASLGKPPLKASAKVD